MLPWWPQCWRLHETLLDLRLHSGWGTTPNTKLSILEKESSQTTWSLVSAFPQSRSLCSFCPTLSEFYSKALYSPQGPPRQNLWPGYSIRSQVGKVLLRILDWAGILEVHQLCPTRHHKRGHSCLAFAKTTLLISLRVVSYEQDIALSHIMALVNLSYNTSSPLHFTICSIKS